MLVSLRKTCLASFFKEVRNFKGMARTMGGSYSLKVVFVPSMTP